MPSSRAANLAVLVCSALSTAVLTATLAGCAPESVPEVDRTTEAQAIRNLDAALSEAAQKRDPEAYSAFFAEEAVQLPPNGPPATGRATIQEGAAGMFGAGADLRFETLDVKVASSGDLAVSRGKYFLRMQTPGGPIQDEGSFLEVWEKVSGEWKITADIYNSDLPEG